MDTPPQRTRFYLKSEWLAQLTLVSCAFVLPISVTATTITFILAWVLILVSGNWAERWEFIRSNLAAISFWILFCLFIFGLFYTVSSGHQAFKDLQKRHWLLIAPFFMMILTDELWRRRILNAFLVAMAITLLISYIKWAGLDLAIKLTGHLRTGNNVFFEHIVQSFFMSVAAFIAGYRVLFEPSLRKLYLIFFILLAVNILFLSAGRTGWAQFGLLALFLCTIRFGAKGALLAIGLGILTLLCAYHFSASFHTRLNAIHKGADKYNQGQVHTPIGLRIAMWHDATALIKKHPWLGVGTGGIKAAMQQNLPNEMIKQTGLIDYVENSFLNFMLEFGVVGLTMFIAFLIALFCASRQLPREYRHLIQAFLIAYLAGSLANSFFVSFCETHLLALIAAVCFSTASKQKEKIYSYEISKS